MGPWDDPGVENERFEVLELVVHFSSNDVMLDACNLLRMHGELYESPRRKPWLTVYHRCLVMDKNTVCQDPCDGHGNLGTGTPGLQDPRPPKLHGSTTSGVQESRLQEIRAPGLQDARAPGL